MAAVIKSMAVEGIDGFPVEVEATTLRGQQQMFSINTIEFTRYEAEITDILTRF